MGLETLAATINEEAVTLEDVYEPYHGRQLLHMGGATIFIDIDTIGIGVNNIGMKFGKPVKQPPRPFEHNGIKIFNAEGFKLSDELENAIEDIVLFNQNLSLCTGADIGRVIYADQQEADVYIDHLAGTVDPTGRKRFEYPFRW